MGQTEIQDQQQVDETNPAASSVDALDQQANQCIMKYAIANMAVGVIPFPLVDLAVLTASQLKMLHSLSKIYGVEFKASLGKSAISSLMAGVGSVYAASPVAASLSKFIPIVGETLSYGTLVILNGTSSYAIGKVFQQHFASGGTFLTFRPETVRDYFAEQMTKGREVAISIVKKDEKKAKGKGAKVAVSDETVVVA